MPIIRVPRTHSKLNVCRSFQPYYLLLKIDLSRLERYPGHSSTATSTRMRTSVDQGDALSHEYLMSAIQRLSLSSGAYHIRFPSHRISKRRC